MSGIRWHKRCSRYLSDDGWNFRRCPNKAEWVVVATGLRFCSRHKPRAKWRGQISRLGNKEATT